MSARRRQGEAEGGRGTRREPPSASGHVVVGPTLGMQIFAALFAGAFFAAIPAWALSQADGPVRWSCRAGPWRCDIDRWSGFERVRTVVGADAVRVERRGRAGRRGAGYTEHRVVFDRADEGAIAVTGWLLDDPRPTAATLEQARRRALPVEASQRSSYHAGMIALTALFFAVGASIVMFSGARGRGAARRDARHAS
jgi:hypothetical protein